MVSLGLPPYRRPDEPKAEFEKRAKERSDALLDHSRMMLRMFALLGIVIVVLFLATAETYWQGIGGRP